MWGGNDCNDSEGPIAPSSPLLLRDCDDDDDSGSNGIHPHAFSAQPAEQPQEEAAREVHATQWCEARDGTTGRSYWFHNRTRVSAPPPPALR